MSVLKVAVIGAGAMGRLHARAIARRTERVGDCELALIIDRHADRSVSVSDEFGGTAGAEEDIEAAGIDAVVLAIPTRDHEALARRCMELGLDVLLEKPMTLGVSEAEGLTLLAERSGRILQVGHTEWYNPGWRRALARVGHPDRIDVERLGPRSARGLDIDVVQDFMLHDLDWVTRIVGEEIVGLEAEGRSVDGLSLDEARVELRFTSGCVAQLQASRVHSARRRVVRIEGGFGTAEADLTTGLLTRLDVGEAGPLDERAVAEEMDASNPGDEPLDAQWADFLRACSDRKAPANDGRVGAAAIALVEQVRNAIGVPAEVSVGADDFAVRR